VLRLETALKLGRVSNLPTVWTNAIAGLLLAGGNIAEYRIIPLIVSMSLLYVGGMFLNDAFDARIDAVERPERPIPSGEISLRTVYFAGFGFLLTAIIILVLLGLMEERGTGVWPAACGLLLAGFILFYDWYHKNNPLSPVIMGICRMMVYVTAASLVIIPISSDVIISAFILFLYLMGLTYVAKQENIGYIKNIWPILFILSPILYFLYIGFDAPISIPFLALFVLNLFFALRFIFRRMAGDIPKAVMLFIAGIALLDAAFIAKAGHEIVAIFAVGAYGLTLLFQRQISGT
jgi:hypothetical protein